MRKKLEMLLVCILLLSLSISVPSYASQQSEPSQLNVVDVLPQFTTNHSPIANASKNQLLQAAQEESNALPDGFFLLPDNPLEDKSGTLTEELKEHYYIFFITESNKGFLVGLQTENPAYEAQLLIVDEKTNDVNESGLSIKSDATPTIYNLPVGEYIIRIHSTSNNHGQPYSLHINATTPYTIVQDHKYITRLKNDFKHLFITTQTGDLYVNEKKIINVNTRSNDSLEWERIDSFNWGSGYEQRTQKVFLIKVKAISSPVKYHSTHASSDDAILIYCDIGTSFYYFHSRYQSGVNHTYWSTDHDVYGRKTPRALDQADIIVSKPILVLDLVSGKIIDFDSKLNEYYQKNAESHSDPIFYYDDPIIWPANKTN